eukprot:TRINITY_DN25537_c0_g1_i1.p1 TRINITY_DN25537_c0_g1~~TRINITY_DN25537_c0_g1_i1.p1  ORF type:complete len:731 (+),score=179.50 TRINITY_DN25537_c0_g1_i1:2-2194(+)
MATLAKRVTLTKATAAAMRKEKERELTMPAPPTATSTANDGYDSAADSSLIEDAKRPLLKAAGGEQEMQQFPAQSSSSTSSSSSAPARPSSSGGGHVAVQIDEGDDSDNDREWTWYERFSAKKSQKHPAMEQRIRRFGCPLEDALGPFNDRFDDFPLKRGQSTKSKKAGRLKAKLQAYPEERAKDFQQREAEGAQIQEALVLVRVYVIGCEGLTAKDDAAMGGKADPYLWLKLGEGEGAKPSVSIKDKDHIKRCTLQPEFFQMYEMKGRLPKDNELRVEVWDYDATSRDDIIGYTVINLEDRWYSYRGGPNLPIANYTEKRPLFLDGSSTPQGSIELWVDVFDLAKPMIPPPIDVTPPPPQEFELRVMVWNARDVELTEGSVGGERMSDVYIRCWLDGMPDDTQETDVHYRCTDGNATFNWRMLYPVQYLPAEKKITSVEKPKFSLFRVRKEPPKRSPNLHVQIWDNDLLPGTDDFIGDTVINLRNIKPIKTRRKNHSLAGSRFCCSPECCLPCVFKPKGAPPPPTLREKQQIAEEERRAEAQEVEREKQRRELELRAAGLPEPEIRQRMKDRRINIFEEIDKGPAVAKKPTAAEALAMAQKGEEDAAKKTGGETPKFWIACYGPNGGPRIGDVQISFEMVPIKALEDEKNQVGKGHSEPNAMPPPDRPASSFFFLTSPFKSFYYVIWRNYRKYLGAVLLTVVSVLAVYWITAQSAIVITNKVWRVGGYT